MQSLKKLTAGILVGLIAMLLLGAHIAAQTASIIPGRVHFYPEIVHTALPVGNHNLSKIPMHYRETVAVMAAQIVYGREDPMYVSPLPVTVAVDVAVSGYLKGIFADAVLPVDPEHFQITSPYGPRNGAMHWGLDIASPNISGQPVYAVKEGTVKFASIASGYGNLVILEHTGNIETYYAHLESIDVAPGDQVTKGQIIGRVGNTGNSTGPHLHFEIRAPIDPAPHLIPLTEPEAPAESEAPAE